MQRTHKLMVFFPLLSVTEMLLTYQVQKSVNTRLYKTTSNSDSQNGNESVILGCIIHTVYRHNPDFDAPVCKIRYSLIPIIPMFI